MSSTEPHHDRSTQANPQTLLVVDDDVLIRLAIAGYLRDCGFQVIEADGAAEAIMVLEREPAIALVFSDIQMPGDLDGFGLARWVKAHRPQVRVILASGVLRASMAASELCEHAGFIDKPYHPESVAAHVRSLLATEAVTGSA